MSSSEDALFETMAARRGQLAYRLVMGALATLCVVDILGLLATASWAALYATIQAIEFVAFRRAARRRGLALALLGANSVAFCILASLVFAAPPRWSGACATLILCATLMSVLRGTLGAREALVVAVSPVLANILLLPLELVLCRFHPVPSVLIGLWVADLLIAYSGLGVLREWNRASQRERDTHDRAEAAQGERHRHLGHLSAHDPLTALPSREMLCARLEEMGQDHVAGTLMLLDLDGFATINDTMGHRVGDALLKIVAARLVEACRPEDFVARAGADEFAIVLPGVNEAKLALEIGERLLACVAAPLMLEGQVVNVGACVGAALHPMHGRNADSLLASADLALAGEKAGGRHGVRLFETDMRAAALARMTREKEIADALDRREFELFYQPQLCLRTGALVGAEALLRWRHPSRGLLTPNLFLAAIERGPLAGQVGQWVLETAAADCAAWRRLGLPGFVVAVNLFGAQFRAGTLVSNVRRALARAELAPDGLEIEITENIILRPEDDIHEPLRLLRDAGIGVALDDYGTGYASLDQLKKMPITRLKIDRSFTQAACDTAEDAAIIRAVASLAEAFRLRVTAEGIETQAQAELVMQAGCGEAQGYLFGRPVPAAEFERVHVAAALGQAPQVEPAR